MYTASFLLSSKREIKARIVTLFSRMGIKDLKNVSGTQSDFCNSLEKR